MLHFSQSVQQINLLDGMRLSTAIGVDNPDTDVLTNRSDFITCKITPWPVDI